MFITLLSELETAPGQCLARSIGGRAYRSQPVFRVVRLHFYADRSALGSPFTTADSWATGFCALLHPLFSSSFHRHLRGKRQLYGLLSVLHLFSNLGEAPFRHIYHRSCLDDFHRIHVLPDFPLCACFFKEQGYGYMLRSVDTHGAD